MTVEEFKKAEKLVCDIEQSKEIIEKLTNGYSNPCIAVGSSMYPIGEALKDSIVSYYRCIKEISEKELKDM